MLGGRAGGKSRGEEITLQDISYLRAGPTKERIILKQINAIFRPGDLSVIEGPIGAGKSTLLHIVCGILRPSTGTVFIGPEPISRLSSFYRDRWRKQVGIAPQLPSLLENRTVRENIALPLIPRTLTRADIEKKSDRVLDLLDISHLSDKTVGSLSSGERQRVVLARAHVGEPGLIIADEPTAHQDEDGARLVFESLASAAKAGATVVLASHNGALLSSNHIARRYRLQDGSLLRQEPEETARQARP